MPRGAGDCGPPSRSCRRGTARGPGPPARSDRRPGDTLRGAGNCAPSPHAPAGDRRPQGRGELRAHPHGPAGEGPRAAGARPHGPTGARVTPSGARGTARPAPTHPQATDVPRGAGDCGPPSRSCRRGTARGRGPPARSDRRPGDTLRGAGNCAPSPHAPAGDRRPQGRGEPRAHPHAPAGNTPPGSGASRRSRSPPADRHRIGFRRRARPARADATTPGGPT